MEGKLIDLTLKEDVPSTDWLDLVRWVATLAVITIHVAAPYLYLYGNIPKQNWDFYNIVDSLSRFAVPLFLMLSGALLLGKSISLVDFLRKRFTRILIPFAFWTTAYTVYHFIVDPQTKQVSFVSFYFDAWLNGASYHLWYIYLIVGIYLCIPILNRWLVNSDDDLIKYYVGLWSLSLVLYFFRCKLNKDFTFSVFSGYLGYLIWGYYLATRTIKINNILIWTILLLSVFFTVFMTNSLTTANHYFNGKYYEYLSLNIVLSASAVFLLLKNQFKLSEKWASRLKYANKYGFGVYLIHVFILDLLQHWGINGAWLNPYVGLIATILICYLASFFLIKTLSRIKWIASLIN